MPLNDEKSPPRSVRPCLDRRRLFFLGCRDAFRDGRVEDFENEFLRELQKTLEVPRDEAQEIAVRARRAAQLEGNGEERSALDPERLFRSACRLAWADGELEAREGELLEDLAELLGLEADQSRQILRQCGSREDSDRSHGIESAPPPRNPTEEPASPPLPRDSSSSQRSKSLPSQEAFVLREIRRWKEEGLIGSILAEQLSLSYQGATLETSSQGIQFLPEPRLSDPSSRTGAPAPPSEQRPPPSAQPPPRHMEAECPPVTFSDLDTGNGGDPSEEPESSLLVSVISLLGALLVGVGAIVFVAANWHRIGPFFKILLLLAGVATTYISAYELFLRHDQAPATGSALVFLGGLLYAAGLALIAQIYHFSIHWYLGFLLWSLGVLPMAFVADSYLLFLFSIMTLAVWTVLEQASPGLCLHWLPFLPSSLRLTNPLFPPLILGIGWFGARRYRCPFTLLIMAGSCWFWLLATPASHRGALGLQLTIAYAFLLILLGLHSEPDEDWQVPARSATTLLSFLAILMGTFSFCFLASSEALVKGIQAQLGHPAGGAVCLYVLLVHLAGAALGFLGAPDAPSARSTSRWFGGLSLATLSPWFLSFLGPYPVAFFYNGLMVATCMGTVKAGVLQRSPGLVNAGLLGIFFWIGSRFLEWFDTMHNVGLTLMLGGGFLLVVTLQIERWRRSLLRQMRDAEEREEGESHE